MVLSSVWEAWRWIECLCVRRVSVAVEGSVCALGTGFSCREMCKIGALSLQTTENEYSRFPPDVRLHARVVEFDEGTTALIAHGVFPQCSDVL